MKPPLFLGLRSALVYNHVARAAREPRVALANCKICLESDTKCSTHLLGPLHIGPVNLASPVSEISPHL